MKHKEKTKRKKKSKHQGSTCDLPCISIFTNQPELSPVLYTQVGLIILQTTMKNDQLETDLYPSEAAAGRFVNEISISYVMCNNTYVVCNI